MFLQSLLFLTLTACDGGTTEEPAPPEPVAAEPEKAPEPPKTPEPPPEPKKPEAPAVLTPDAEGIVRVEATDQMKYNTDRIEVEGTKVKLELKHVGTMPKQGMGHNLVVLKPGTNPIAWAAQATSAAATEYIPEGNEEMIAHTRLLGGGESDTIEFEVPGPGEYPFVCSYPGHAALMVGVLVVK